MCDTVLDHPEQVLDPECGGPMGSCPHMLDPEPALAHLGLYMAPTPGPYCMHTTPRLPRAGTPPPQHLIWYVERVPRLGLHGCFI